MTSSAWPKLSQRPTEKEYLWLAVPDTDDVTAVLANVVDDGLVGLVLDFRPSEIVQHVRLPPHHRRRSLPDRGALITPIVRRVVPGQGTA